MRIRNGEEVYNVVGSPEVVEMMKEDGVPYEELAHYEFVEEMLRFSLALYCTWGRYVTNAAYAIN